MTEKTLEALETGDFVADMHDGVGPIRRRFGIVSHTTWHGQSFVFFVSTDCLTMAPNSTYRMGVGVFNTHSFCGLAKVLLQR